MIKLVTAVKGTCAVCGMLHNPEDPHNLGEEYYKLRFYAENSRLPTWADAIAHCDISTQVFWLTELSSRKLWTTPDSYDEVVAEYPKNARRRILFVEETNSGSR
jgi:hypothetical protein